MQKNTRKLTRRKYRNIEMQKNRVKYKKIKESTRE